EAVPLSRGPDLRALAALFVLTLRQHARGRRLLVLSLLFALPSVLAAVVSLAARRPPPAGALEFAFVFNLIPHTLAPLTALLYAAGLIRDEAEEQTLTYLLLRPLPRWALYLVKLLATLLVTCLLTGVFTAAAAATIAVTASEPVGGEVVRRALATAGVLGPAEGRRCGRVGALGVLAGRSV